MTAFRIACLCCAVLLLATAAVATSSRVEALGKTGDYLEDDSKVWRWWGSLVLHPDRVIIEPGRYHGGNADETVTHQGGSIHVGLGHDARYGVLAVRVSSDLPEPNTPGESFEAAYAVRLGRFAPGAYFRGTSYQDLDAGPLPYFRRNDSFWYHDLGIGVRTDLGRGHSCELGAYRREVQFSFDRGSHRHFDSSWDSWGLRARARIVLDPTFDLLPVFDYLSPGHDTADRNLDAPVRRDGEVWRVGLGGNLRLAAGQLVVLAAEYGREIVHMRGADEYHDLTRGELDHWNAALRLGFESEVLHWLTVRGAATYQRYRTTTDFGDYMVWQGAPTHAHLGVAFDFEPLTIDLTYGHTTPLEPGQLQADLYPDDSTEFLTGSLRYAW